MPLKHFICPDAVKIRLEECLKEGGCRMRNRCATRSYLRLVASERPWNGKPSTTQLIQGTMQAFLKLTQNYAVSPDQRAFMINGTRAHETLEASDDEFSFLEEKFEGKDTPETGISDVFEIENGKSILADYKTSGSYKVAKALGFYVDTEETGEIFKTGKRKGEAKTRQVLKRDDARIDRWEWELQLNKYRLEFEKRGFKVDELKIQCIVRDGNTHIARSRGVFRNVYYFNITKLPDEEVLAYFEDKRKALFQALELGEWKTPCSAKENWDGLKCANYCEVAEFCPLGKYLKREKESEDMAIKNLSEIRRLPRLGKIRLGIKKTKTTDKGIVEYPTEVDYFILDPQTPSELENKKLIEEFHKLYSEQPKAINIMFPLSNPETIFPQFYKRYGKTTLLQCKGDGVEAICASEEFTERLKVIRKSDLGLPVVECLGRECPYYKEKKCTESATLQVLLPELQGAGVWQITTGSFNSIVNINSCLEYIKALAGRFHMIPLQLERREQETTHKDNEGKQHKGKHHILHIDMKIKLADLQRYAQIDSTKILLELPAPEEDKEDILLATTPIETESNGLKKATEIFDAKIVEDDAFGDPARFGKDKEKASAMLEQLKNAQKKLGDERFLYCVGQGGFGKVREINKLSDLVNLVNVVLCEVRNKEQEN
jgi:hypothetical protein